MNPRAPNGSASVCFSIHWSQGSPPLRENWFFPKGLPDRRASDRPGRQPLKQVHTKKAFASESEIITDKWNWLGEDSQLISFQFSSLGDVIDRVGIVPT